MHLAPALAVVERGADVAIALLLAVDGSAPRRAALDTAWAGAVELDAAPLAALEVAARLSMGRRAATLAMPGGEASLRAELAAISREASQLPKHDLTTFVVTR